MPPGPRAFPHGEQDSPRGAANVKLARVRRYQNPLRERGEGEAATLPDHRWVDESTKAQRAKNTCGAASQSVLTGTHRASFASLIQSESLGRQLVLVTDEEQGWALPGHRHQRCILSCAAVSVPQQRLIRLEQYKHVRN